MKCVAANWDREFVTNRDQESSLQLIESMVAQGRRWTRLQQSEVAGEHDAPEVIL
jgi:hypothetical protein